MKQAIKYIRQQLQNIYPAEEVQAEVEETVEESSQDEVKTEE